MSEERAQYLLKPDTNHATMETQPRSDFVEVRTRRGKLVFRFDPTRMLVEWQDRREVELIDLMPYLR